MSKLFAGEQKAVAFKNTSVSQDATVESGQGRIEIRTVTVFHDIDWLQDRHQWPDLNSVVMVESRFRQQSARRRAALKWASRQRAPQAGRPVGLAEDFPQAMSIGVPASKWLLEGNVRCVNG